MDLLVEEAGSGVGRGQRTVQQMDTTSDTHNEAVSSMLEKISNPEAFGQVVSLLTNLSRYLDMVANAVLSGNASNSVAPFTNRAVSIYEELRAKLIGFIVDDDLRTSAAAMLRTMDGVVDPIEAALVADQAQLWVETTLRYGAFSHKMNLISMQIGLEEAAVSAQLHEQREKALTFEHRINGGNSKVPGTYI